MSVSSKGFFRTAILKKSLTNYYNLNMHKSKLNEKFSLLARELNKKPVIETCESFLKNIYLLHGKNIPDKSQTKILLSCYMIEKHPNVLLSDETEIEVKVQKKSKMVLETLNEVKNSTNNFAIRFNTNRFIKLFDEYLVLFDEWKNQDKLKILNDLHTIYFELEADKVKRQNDNNPNQEVFINDINREQKKIVEKIQRIGGQEGINNFEKLKEQMTNYSKAVERNFETINNIIHTAFWDNVREQLSKDPPNMLVILPLLDDLKKMLKQCVPNRGDLHEQLNSNINTEHIEDMIKHDAIDNRFIITIVRYIFNFIETFQSSGDDKDFSKIKESLLDRYSNGMYLRDFFPEFFKEAFMMTEKILKESEELKQMPEYETIKEMYKNHMKNKKRF